MNNGGRIRFFCEYYPLQEQSKSFAAIEKEKIRRRLELTSINLKEIFELQNQVQYP